MTVCVSLCPGTSAKIYGACMQGCAERCEDVRIYKVSNQNKKKDLSEIPTGVLLWYQLGLIVLPSTVSHLDYELRGL